MQKISVILPVYNGGTYLKLSVESVLNQYYEDFELLILDDCSNDGSREYLDGLSDKRIVYFKKYRNDLSFPTAIESEFKIDLSEILK